MGLLCNWWGPDAAPVVAGRVETDRRSEPATLAGLAEGVWAPLTTWRLVDEDQEFRPVAPGRGDRAGPPGVAAGRRRSRGWSDGGARVRAELARALAGLG